MGNEEIAGKLRRDIGISRNSTRLIVTTLSLALTLHTIFARIALAQEKSLLEQMPRIPPKSIAEALASFKLQHGFSLELVASEPDVVDPIDIAFDDHNRMFVVEMNDYPFLPEQRVQKYKDQRPETWGRIRLLTDTDNDGKMDKSVIFADRLRWPQSVCCYRDGVYVIAPPDLLFMKDTNGDDVADTREIICTGFNTANVQGLSNGLEWGRDNAIYFSSGLSGGDLTVPAGDGKPERKFTPGRRDLRLDPATNELTMVAGGLQYGHTIDNWGERFICTNSNHIVHVTWPLKYLERNPLLAIPDMTRSIGKEGAAAVVYRTSPPEPWRLVRTARRAADPEMRKRLPASELVPTGFFTSATGVTVYRGAAYPPEFQGNVFIGDCGSNLVHRKTLKPDGISYIAERADQDVEFLTSTDNWFRPVNFVNAPDGTLYVIDMYRETIEHPFSIPDDIKELVDLESGHDRGRIWRLIPPDYERVPPPDLGRATTEDLIEHLKSPHGWIRETAQRLIVERNDRTIESNLREITDTARFGAGNNPPEAQLHALWTLQGLGALQAIDVFQAAASEDDHLCEFGLRLLPKSIVELPGHTTLNLRQRDSDFANLSLRIRWRIAFMLGDFPPEMAIPILKQISRAAANDADLRIAWLSSVYSNMGTIAAELLLGDAEPVMPLLEELARLIGSSSDPTDSLRLLNALVRDSVSDTARTNVILALGEGLLRRGTTISSVLEKSQAGPELTEPLKKIFQRASDVAKNESVAEADRLSGTTLLALADSSLAERTLPELLTPQTSPALQQAAVKSLAAHRTEQGFHAILLPWKGFGPATRREVVDSLVQSVQGATSLINAVENGAIKPGEIERDKRQLLLNHPQLAIRDAAKRVLSEPPSNRKNVVSTYQPALELTGDIARGKKLYAKTCIQCHRAGTEGHLVGPDFASVKNKSPEDLLVAILDPNREAQPNYQTYTALTKQGKIYAGIIASETAASLTLKRAEAKEDVVLRDTLDELVSNGVSLMPEGMEKDLDKQQLADLIAWIKNGQ